MPRPSGGGSAGGPGPRRGELSRWPGGAPTQGARRRTGVDHQLLPARRGAARGGSVMSEPRDDFEALLSPILPIAYGTAVRLTRDRTEAEDLVQDAALLA